jgi:hypothetical protein
MFYRRASRGLVRRGRQTAECILAGEAMNMRNNGLA